MSSGAEHWVWWSSGLALAGVAVSNWFLSGRMLAVSGRFTALVDRLRFGEPASVELSAEEMMAAVRAATAEAFGGEALAETAPEGAALAPTAAPPRNSASHILFLLCLVIGGAASALMAGRLDVTTGLDSVTFASIFGTARWATPFVLVVGGMMVGFGTRMAAGCTSGHGLCGVSRFQIGSLVATMAFFGTGIAVSLLLRGFG